MYIQLDNQNIYYQKVGQGKDLIMLHGWGQDVATFWTALDYLKDDFTLWSNFSLKETSFVMPINVM